MGYGQSSVCQQSLKVVIELNCQGGFQRRQTASPAMPLFFLIHLSGTNFQNPDSTTYFAGLLSNLCNLSSLCFLRYKMELIISILQCSGELKLCDPPKYCSYKNYWFNFLFFHKNPTLSLELNAFPWKFAFVVRSVLSTKSRQLYLI